jgi:hypothetical protein
MTYAVHESRSWPGEGLTPAPVSRRYFDLLDVQGTLEYRFHEGAQTALTLIAALCFFLVLPSPVGVWLLSRRSKGKVKISLSEVVAEGLGGRTSFRFDEIARLGLHEVPIVVGGMGGALARRRVGGDKAIYLVARTHSGQTRKVLVSSYENSNEIIRQISVRAQKACEGGLG